MSDCVERQSAGSSEAFAAKRRMDRRSSLDSHAGFSLLEVLVAFTLLALAMGVVMQIFSRGVNGATLADRYAKATMYAESMLSSVGSETELKEGSTGGKFDDDFSWAIAVRAYQDPYPKDQAVVDYEKLMPTQLFEVELKVSFMAEDQRERVLNLSTLRMGPKT